MSLVPTNRLTGVKNGYDPCPHSPNVLWQDTDRGIFCGGCQDYVYIKHLQHDERDELIKRYRDALEEIYDGASTGAPDATRMKEIALKALKV